MKPLVEAAYKKYNGKIKFVVVDVMTEQGSALANEMQVFGIPAMFFIDKNGTLVDYYSGKLTQQELNKRLENLH